MRMGRQLHSLQMNGGITAVARSGASSAVVADNTGRVKWWHYGANHVIYDRQFHNSAITALQVDADECVTGDAQGAIKVSALHTGNPKRVLSEHTGAINDLSMDRGKFVSCSADGSIKVWSRDNGARMASLLGGSLQARSSNPENPTRPGVSFIRFDESRVVAACASVVRLYSFAPELDHADPK